MCRAPAFKGPLLPKVEVEDLEKEPRVLRAKVAAAPQLSRKESHAPGEATGFL